jgi:hypothetical protein
MLFEIAASVPDTIEIVGYASNLSFSDLQSYPYLKTIDGVIFSAKVDPSVFPSQGSDPDWPPALKPPAISRDLPPKSKPAGRRRRARL